MEHFFLHSYHQYLSLPEKRLEFIIYYFFNLVSPKYKLIILSPDFIQNLVTTGNLNFLLEISDYF